MRISREPLWRCALSGALILLLVGAAGGAAPPLPSTPVAPRIDVEVPGLSFWWTGNAGWLVRSKDALIGFDQALEPEPFLDEFSMDVRYARPIRAAELGELKVLLRLSCPWRSLRARDHESPAQGIALPLRAAPLLPQGGMNWGSRRSAASWPCPGRPCGSTG